MVALFYYLLFQEMQSMISVVNSSTRKITLYISLSIQVNIRQMTEVSEDIFFQVKKEILDKLDVILQKVNLQIINYIKPDEDQYNFIELATFQQEITHLFGYLDRLYASLNSSVSYSSIQSYKQSAEQYQAQNERLAQENHKLKKLLQQISESSVERVSSQKLTFELDMLNQLRESYHSKLEPLKLQIKNLGHELRSLMKHLKKQLKSYKFQMLQTRVEVIAKLKDWQFDQTLRKKESKQIEIGCTDLNHCRDSEEILDTINQIISIC